MEGGRLRRKGAHKEGEDLKKINKEGENNELEKAWEEQKDLEEGRALEFKKKKKKWGQKSESEDF